MPRDAGVLGLGQRLRHAELAFGEARLLKPGQRPAGIGVEVALLLSEHLVKGLVDEGKGLAHGQRIAAGVQHSGVAGEHRHARPYCGLGQIHRGDVALLHLAQRVRQLGLQCVNELTSGGDRRIGGARSAYENDAGGEGVGALC